MDRKTYERIRKYVMNHLGQVYWNTHLDDCVQYMAIRIFQRGEKNTLFKYIFLEYCKNVGLSKYASQKQQTTQHKMLSIHEKSREDDKEDREEFLLYDKAKEIYENQQKKTNTRDHVNDFTWDFLTMFKINEETKLWATDLYKHKALNKIIS